MIKPIFSDNEKKLIQRLHESEDFVRQIANSTPDIIYVLHLQHNKFTYTNSRAEEILGPQSIFAANIHPLDYEKRLVHLQECSFLKRGETKEINIRMKVKSGEWHWFNIRNTAFKFNRSGYATHVIGVARDIQESKLHEEQLLRKKKLLNGVLNAHSIGIVVYEAVRDHQGDIIDFEFVLTSKTFEEFHNRSELVGKRVLEEFPEIPEEEQERWKKVVNEDVVVDAEVNFPNPITGQTHWFHTQLEKLGDGFIIVWEDITEKKQAELQILQTKNLLESIFESAPISISCTKSIRNETGKIIDFEIIASNSANSRTGKKDLVGKRVSEAYPAVFNEQLDRLIAVVESGKPNSWQQYYHNGQGEKWFQLSFVKLGDGYLATAEDVTEKREAEKKRLESKRMLEAVFAAVPVRISVFKSIRDPQNRIIDFESMLSNSRSLRTGSYDLVGKKLSEMIPQAGTEGLDKAVAVVETGKPDSWELCYNENGVERWFYASAVKLGDGFVGTGLDITELKQTQQKLDRSECFVNSIIDSTPETILLFDIQTWCNIYANQHITRLLGYTPEEMIAMGTKVFEICIHPDDYPQQMNELKNCCHNSEDEVHTSEFRLLHKSGIIRWVEVRRSVFKCDATGKPIQIIAMMNDITRQKMAEEILGNRALTSSTN
jgi:PAS domain S-box-containing protein